MGQPCSSFGPRGLPIKAISGLSSKGPGGNVPHTQFLRCGRWYQAGTTEEDVKSVGVQRENWCVSPVRSASAWTMVSVISVYTPPDILTKLNFFCMSRDIPLEKHASSSRIYSLNVAPFHLPNFLYLCVVDIPVKKQANSSHIYSLNVSPFHLPIFCICVLLYPARASTFAPLLQSKCVLICCIGIPFTTPLPSMLDLYFLPCR